MFDHERNEAPARVCRPNEEVSCERQRLADNLMRVVCRTRNLKTRVGLAYLAGCLLDSDTDAETLAAVLSAAKRVK